MEASTLVTIATNLFMDVVNTIELETIVLSSILQLLLMLSKFKFNNTRKYVQKTKPRCARRVRRNIQTKYRPKVGSSGPLALKGILLIFLQDLDDILITYKVGRYHK